MFAKYLVAQRIARIAVLAGTSAVFLAACGSNGTDNATATATNAPVTAASAIIKHTPSGTIQMMWDPTAHVLNVHLALTGLAPNSIHPALINAGTCQVTGKKVYALTDVKANDIGFADTITKISSVTTGIPANGWYVEVYNGPGMTAVPENEAITCADVVNPVASTKTVQNVQATMLDADVVGQSTSGTAQLTVNNNQLTVVLAVNGLVPHSKHMAHIHFGSCSSEGKIVYPLNAVVANAAGDGSSTTVIPGVSSMPESGWYVNVHRGTDVSTQTGFDPVACGDITPAR